MRSSRLAGLMLLATSSLVACVGEEADEDAAADAFTGGKADELGFPLGHFANIAGDNQDGDAVVAAFHAGDTTLPDGESGLFDLARFRDYDTDYDQGTFKIYKYRGRDRIRFTNADGRVVLRSDWSFENSDLLLDEDVELRQLRRRPEELVDCLTFQVVDPGVFEESLSPYEYPSVSVDTDGDEHSLEIGGSSYDSTDSTITVDAGEARFEAVATTEHGDKVILRVPNTAPRRGELLQQESGGSEELVAKVVCR